MQNEEIGIALAQFVEVALRGDPSSLPSYAKHLTKCLRDAGDHETAEQIEVALKEMPTTIAKIAKLRRTNGKPIPVDSESRLSLADEKLVVNPVNIILPPRCFVLVSRFLRAFQHTEELLRNGVAVPNSLLLYGPPGCGKTLLAEHVAHSLSLPLLTARADGLVSSYLGSTAKNIRSLFEHAAEKKCVLFLDEFDSIAKMRDDKHEVGELKRVVISLLQNIDAAGESLIFVAATNHSHLLDPAVWRRFSYSISIPLPDGQDRTKLLEHFFGGRFINDEIAVIAAITEGLSGAQLKGLSDDIIRDAILDGAENVTLSSAIRIIHQIHNQIPPDHPIAPISDAVRAVRLKLGKTMTQSRLAEMFEISQSKVSRILSEK